MAKALIPEGLMKRLINRFYAMRTQQTAPMVLRTLIQEVYSQGLATRSTPTIEGFEEWANLHGGLCLIKSETMENESPKLYPATYLAQMTEMAWRAYANRKE